MGGDILAPHISNMLGQTCGLWASPFVPPSSMTWAQYTCKVLGGGVELHKHGGINEFIFAAGCSLARATRFQRGNAQAIIYRSQRDRFASGRGLPPAASAEWALGSY